MNRTGIAATILGGWLGLPGTPALAQNAPAFPESRQVYGTSWGVASYGLKRTGSDYASPFGVGYGYGIRPLGFVPGRYGAELWHPGEVGPAGTYGVEHRYRTFPYPYPPGPPAYGPSIGVYAPYFGSTPRSAPGR